MSDWNPALYTRLEDERTRLAAELPTRVPVATARQVVGLGCGPGDASGLLVPRYPSARAGGKRLLAFARLFSVARRRDG